MDNLSEYVPLILILGSIIYSVVKGGSKKNEEKTAKTTLPGHQDTKKFDFPDFLPQEKPIQKVKKKTKVKKNEPVPVRQTVASSVKCMPLEMEEIVEESEELVLDTSDADELKKAFIYTEILGRKEY